MIVGLLYNAKDTLQKLYDVENSKLALKIRKVIKKVSEEITVFEEEKENYIKKHAVEGTDSIPMDSPEYAKAIEYLNELLNTEVEVSWEPVISSNEIEELNIPNLSVRDIDNLEIIGILKED